MKAFETCSGPKQYIRDLICSSALEELNDVRKIFTLPSREALCYKTFKKVFPKAHIACIEYKKEIVAELWDKGIECQHTDIKTYAKEKVRLEMHHDVIFLDYYSYLSPKILDEISTFLNNDNIIHQGRSSIVGITLQKSMRGKKDETLELLSKYRYKGFRTGTENNITEVTQGVNGFLQIEFNFNTIDVLEAFEYKASENSTPMYFMLFKVQK